MEKEKRNPAPKTSSEISVFTRALMSYNQRLGRYPLTMGIGRFEALFTSPKEEEKLELERMRREDDRRKKELFRDLKSAIDIK